MAGEAVAAVARDGAILVLGLAAGRAALTLPKTRGEPSLETLADLHALVANGRRAETDPKTRS